MSFFLDHDCWDATRRPWSDTRAMREHRHKLTHQIHLPLSSVATFHVILYYKGLRATSLGYSDLLLPSRPSPIHSQMSTTRMHSIDVGSASPSGPRTMLIEVHQLGSPPSSVRTATRTGPCDIDLESYIIRCKLVKSILSLISRTLTSSDFPRAGTDDAPKSIKVVYALSEGSPLKPPSSA